MNWIKKLFTRQASIPTKLTISFDIDTLEKYQEGKEMYIQCITGHKIVVGVREIK